MAYIRENCVAGAFYPSGAAACREELAAYTAFDAGGVEYGGMPVAGIVPHAGWAYSGGIAGKVFSFLKQRGNPKVFIVFGAVHSMRADVPAVMSCGEWDTPIGTLPVAEDAAKALIGDCGCPVEDGAAAHEGEHSIEVQMPFIKYLFPDAAVVPVLAPPSEYAIAIGKAAGRLMASRPAGEVVAVGSTDLTHYGKRYNFAPRGEGEGALRWVKEVNDRKFIDAARDMDSARILSEARSERNACGAGAAAAAVSAAKEAGAGHGVLLEYATSHDVIPQGRPTLFVGYAGIVF